MAKTKTRKIKKGERSAGQYPDKVKKLGKRIKELRKEQGYVSALDFALEKDVSFTQMARWETGKNMTFESLCKLAESFGMPLSKFLDGI